MKCFHLLNRTALALTGLALALNQGIVNAKEHPPIRIIPLSGNAGVSVIFTPTSDPAIAKATVTGVVQNLPLGTCIDNAELEARFPANPSDPVIVNGTATFTALDGVNSLKFTVSGSATPDPLNPGFYNAKYQITFTGGTGAYVSAKGVAEITEVVMFTSAATATATWTIKGFVVTPH